MEYQQTREESWIFSSLDMLGETSRLHSAHKMTAPCNRGLECGYATAHHVGEGSQKREAQGGQCCFYELNIKCNVARLLPLYLTILLFILHSCYAEAVSGYGYVKIFAFKHLTAMDKIETI